MITLRPFQSRACANAMRSLSRVRAACLVAPTGAGKTVMGAAIVRHQWQRGKRILFVAHRRELILQTVSKLRSFVDAQSIGVIMPGHQRAPWCPVQVASIQTMLSQGFPDSADLVVTDEAQHYRADDWSVVIDHYPDAKVLGLTATPIRADGRALGDSFDELIVAAQYSELINDGYIVPCRVYQPERGLGSNEVAQDPLGAYQTLASGTRAFGFAARVEQCEDLARRFTASGISSRVVEAGTPKSDRDSILASFRSGNIRVLWNVYALTEGVDVPEAETVVIARKMDHVGMYLQCCGRVLRPAPGKTEAIIIDLSGATLKHGFPTEDREYSLEGNAIKRTSVEPLRTCPACGFTTQAWRDACPQCGFVPPQVEAPKLRIYDEKLRLVFDGMKTPESAKQAEYRRLRELGRARGWSLYFVQKEYAKLFGERPIIDDASPEERRLELERLEARRSERGYKPAWSAVQFRNLFGEWPRIGDRL